MIRSASCEFQRIVPCVGGMLAKAFSPTRIVAARALQRVISNGDLAPCCADAARGGAASRSRRSRPSSATAELAALAADYPADDARAAYVYYNHVVNAATYLFFLGVGTYDVYSSDVEYPAGDRTIRLKLLCLPGVRRRPARPPRSARSRLGAVDVPLVGPSSATTTPRGAGCALLAERERLKLADGVPPGEPGASRRRAHRTGCSATARGSRTCAPSSSA